MDDKEYYSLMNRKSSWLLQQSLKKKNKDSKSDAEKKSEHLETYKNIEIRQGKADAEMLLEKKNNGK